mgnify:CR=1 FL=1
MEVQPGKCINYLLCLKAHVDDGEQEIENVTWLAMFTRPEIGIVFDTALFIGCDGVALHYPFDGAFPIDYVFIGCIGNAFDGVVIRAL